MIVLFDFGICSGVDDDNMMSWFLTWLRIADILGGTCRHVPRLERQWHHRWPGMAPDVTCLLAQLACNAAHEYIQCFSGTVFPAGAVAGVSGPRATCLSLA